MYAPSQRPFRAPSWSYQDPSDHSTHVSYELPYRTHHAARYPVLSPNGSSIFLYGHQDGLAVVWRGGGSPKHDSASSVGQPGVNQAEDAMVIDGNGNENENATSVRPGRFGGSGDDPDSTGPVRPIVAFADITLGAAVLDLDVPPLPPSLAEQPVRTVPTLFAHRIVATAVCSDGTTRVITLPLAPSADSLTVDLSASSEESGVDCTIVGAAHPSQRRSMGGVSVTFVPMDPREAGMDDSDSDHQDPKCDGNLIVAAYAKAPLESITISRLPLRFDKSKPRWFNPAQEKSNTTHLPHSLSCIAFSSARLLSGQRPRLLLADSSGAVRLAMVEAAWASNAKPSLQWLGTMHVPFRHTRASSISSAGQRRQILAANWVLTGKAVMVLLDNGQWGIWDLEGAGPLWPGSMAQTNSHSICGGGSTHFTMSGSIGQSRDSGSGLGSQLSLRPKPSSSTRESNHLVPMTPKTRKVKQERLFSNSGGADSSARLRNGPVSGGCSVMHVETLNQQAPDERLVMWYGGDVCIIPSLRQHWQRSVGAHTGQSSNTIQSYGLTHIQIPSTALGEKIVDIFQLPAESNHFQSVSRFSHDIVITLEHRITILCAEGQRKKTAEELRGLFQQNDVDADDGSKPERQDLDRLRRGELDLGGMNRLLDSMSGAEHLDSDMTAPRLRRVGFAA